MSRPQPASRLLVALAGLLLAGCAADPPAADEPPKTTQPTPTNIKDDEDTPEPTAPPLGSPRPKVGPGSVLLEEDDRRGAGH